MVCGRILIQVVDRRRTVPVTDHSFRRGRWGELRRWGDSPAKVLRAVVDGGGGGGGCFGEGIADEGVEALEVRPRRDVAAVGLDDLGLLHLELLLGGVDAVLALDVAAAELRGRGVDGVDGVGDLLPVLLSEISAVQVEVVGPPRVNQRPGCFLRPAVLSAGESGCPRRRRRRPRFGQEVGFRGGGRGEFLVIGDDTTGGGGAGCGGRARRRRSGLG